VTPLCRCSHPSATRLWNADEEKALEIGLHYHDGHSETFRQVEYQENVLTCANCLRPIGTTAERRAAAAARSSSFRRFLRKHPRIRVLAYGGLLCWCAALVRFVLSEMGI